MFSLSLSLSLLSPWCSYSHLAGNTLGAGHPSIYFFISTSFSTQPHLHVKTGLHQRQYPPPMAIQILPEICISPPPPSDDVLEPFSPFDNIKFTIEEDINNYRPALLSPPPMPTTIPRHLSPLSPEEVPVKGQGLERERFEMLLKSSRERSAALGNKKAPDLRKELALKTYKSKQSASSRLIVYPSATLTLCSVGSGTPRALLAQGSRAA